MEYSPIDSKAYGVTTASSQPPSVPNCDKQRGEIPLEHNEGPAKAAGSQTAPGSSSDPSSKKASEIEHSTETSNDSIRDAKSSPETTAPNAPPKAGSLDDISETAEKRARDIIASQGEAMKKRRRLNIARSIGREDDPDSIDSDEERAYWDRIEKSYEEEEARRKALTPEERRREDVEKQAPHFRDYIKPCFERRWSNRKILTHYPIFYLQSAPPSNNGATCQLDCCTERILPGDYRIAVVPGQNYYHNPDYYHVTCFEELLDLSSPHYLARFDYDRHKHIPDYGAMCILKEYLRRLKVRIGVLDNDAQPAADPASNAPDSDAGPSNNTPGDESIVPKQSDETTREAPIALGLTAQNQPAEEDEWRRADDIWTEVKEDGIRRSKENCAFSDIFAVYLEDGDSAIDWKITNYVSDEEHPDYNERHSLSKALSKWDIDARLALKDIDTLDERGLRAREDLGEETIEKIKKYARPHLPAYGGLAFSPD